MKFKRHPEHIAFAGNFKDYQENRKRHLLSAFLTVEEGGILDGNLMRLDALYVKGNSYSDTDLEL